MASRFPTPAAARENVHWRAVAQAVGLVVLMAVCYWRTFDGGFYWDDDLSIPGNAAAGSLQGLKDLWFSTKPYDYYPVTYTVFWLEWHGWGHEALGYHLTGFLFGLLSVFLLWATLARLRVPGAWWGALWFAVHPVGVASVAWISEGKNTLSLAFALGSLLAFIRGGGLDDGRVQGRWYALSWGLFVLAALSKSSVIILPGVLLLLTWWKQGKVRRASWWMSLPFFAVSLAAGLATIWFHQHRAMRSEIVLDLSFPVRLCLAGRTILFYLGKAFWPTHLSMIYPRWELAGAALRTAVPTALVATGLGVAWRWRDRWGRGPFTALAYFVLSLLPVSGLLTAALFWQTFVYDHLMYLALGGATASVAAGLAIWRRTPGGTRLAPVAMGLVTVGLLAGSVLRADDFTSPEKLWRATLAVNPDAYAAHNNLGLIYLNTGRPAAAETEFRAATLAGPQLLPAWENLACALQQQGRWREVTSIYGWLLSRRPDAQEFNNAGVAWLELGDGVRARPLLQQAARLEPRMLSPHFNLSKLALSQGDYLGAVEELAVCLRLDPDDAPSLLTLAALDLAAAAPGAVPPAALTLAKRANRMTGARDPLPRQIIQQAARAVPPPATPARMPEVALRIERCVNFLSPSPSAASL